DGDRAGQRARALVPGCPRARKRDLGRGRGRGPTGDLGPPSSIGACMSRVLDEAIAAIREPDPAVGAEVQRRLHEKTKPRGSLGGLERLAVRIASIQRTPEPSLGTPVVVVCAA